MKKKTILVGLSGGVDSATTAAILKNEGHTVIGVTMKLWDGPADSPSVPSHSCYGPGESRNFADAAQICDTLGIDYHVLDLSAEFKHDVLDYVRDDYQAGRTPNPCIQCNVCVKFGAMLQKARERGIAFDHFATGHYARVVYNPASGRYEIHKAANAKKDQSYFLYRLTQAQLSIVRFPLADYKKDQVRQLAASFGLAVADKDDSQDFFAGGHERLLQDIATPGPILNSAGEQIGAHQGIVYYTVGQRKGLGIAAANPLYVLAKDAGRNSVIVGGKEELYQNELTASAMNWVAIAAPDQPLQAQARIRYMHRDAACHIFPEPPDRVRVVFAEPQLAITPGQSVVLYDRERLLGGGIIASAANPGVHHEP